MVAHAGELWLVRDAEKGQETRDTFRYEPAQSLSMNSFGIQR